MCPMTDEEPTDQDQGARPRREAVHEAAETVAETVAEIEADEDPQTGREAAELELMEEGRSDAGAEVGDHLE